MASGMPKEVLLVAHVIGRTSTDLLEQLDISAEEIERRKKFLEFSAEDITSLESINGLAEEYADQVIDEFYRHLLSFEEARDYFSDPKVLEYVKGRQRDYFLGLTHGDYGTRYVGERLAIGAVHERIGLPMKLYLGMYNFYLRAVATRLFSALKDEPERAQKIFSSLMKLTFLDIGLAIDTYIQQRENTIHVQQEAIRELSTPVLQLRERLLILPIVGVIDSQRARQLTEQLLRSIRSNRAKVVVIDITGVPVVDTTVANHLVQTVEASRLMGATAIITGLSPEIARTLVTIGVDLSKMDTMGDLQEGIEEAERLLGYDVKRIAPDEAR
jgi:rsbT co-antagonist protein RsbR